MTRRLSARESKPRPAAWDSQPPREFLLDHLAAQASVVVRCGLARRIHSDHDGGAVLLQDSIPGVHVIYGAEDWHAVDKRLTGKAKHDMVGTDGMKVSVGDAFVQIVTMPLSYLFEIRDNGKLLRVAYVGGTAIPFNGSAAYYDSYIASSKKMAKAAADYGATALMSNHSEFDDAYFKAHAAAKRKRGEPNPFDVGADGVARYFTVVQACTTAVRIRATGQ